MAGAGGACAHGGICGLSGERGGEGGLAVAAGAGGAAAVVVGHGGGVVVEDSAGAVELDGTAVDHHVAEEFAGALDAGLGAGEGEAEAGGDGKTMDVDSDEEEVVKPSRSKKTFKSAEFIEDSDDE